MPGKYLLIYEDDDDALDGRIQAAIKARETLFKRVLTPNEKAAVAKRVRKDAKKEEFRRQK